MGRFSQRSILSSNIIWVKFFNILKIKKNFRYLNKQLLKELYASDLAVFDTRQHDPEHMLYGKGVGIVGYKILFKKIFNLILAGI